VRCWSCHLVVRVGGDGEPGPTGGQYCEGAIGQAPIRSLPVWSGAPVAASTPSRQVNRQARNQWDVRVGPGVAMAGSGQSSSMGLPKWWMLSLSSRDLVVIAVTVRRRSGDHRHPDSDDHTLVVSSEPDHQRPTGMATPRAGRPTVDLDDHPYQSPTIDRPQDGLQPEPTGHPEGTEPVGTAGQARTATSWISSSQWAAFIALNISATLSALAKPTEPDDTEPDDTEPDDTEPDDTEPGDTELSSWRPSRRTDRAHG